MAVLPTPESIEVYLAEDSVEVVYAGECSTTVIAPEVHGEWDLILLVRYPSRQVFTKMVTDPEYLEVAELRSRGLDSLLQATRELFPQPAGG